MVARITWIVHAAASGNSAADLDAMVCIPQMGRRMYG